MTTLKTTILRMTKFKEYTKSNHTRSHHTRYDHTKDDHTILAILEALKRTIVTKKGNIKKTVRMTLIKGDGDLRLSNSAEVLD